MTAAEAGARLRDAAETLSELEKADPTKGMLPMALSALGQILLVDVTVRLFGLDP